MNKNLMFASDVFKIGMQSLYILLMAKFLGANSFGVFSVAQTVVLMFTPFAGFGAGHVLVRYGANSPRMVNDYFNNAICKIILTAILFLPIVTLLLIYIAKQIAVATVFLLFFTEFALVKFYEVSTQLNQVKEAYHKIAFINFLVGFARALVVLILFVLEETQTLESWVLLLFIVNIPVTFVVYKISGQRFFVSFQKDKIGEGVYFSLGLLSQMIYKEADKSIVHIVKPGSHLGDYSIANKIVDLAFTPVRVFYQIKYKGYFVHGAKGTGGVISYALSILKTSIPLSLALSISIYFCADYFIFFLGNCSYFAGKIAISGIFSTALLGCRGV